MLARKTAFLGLAAVLLVTVGGVWAMRGRFLTGQTVPAGTFKASAGSTVMDSNRTLQIPQSTTSVLLEWNSSNSAYLYAYSTVAHPQWGNGSYFDASNATAVRAQYGIQSIDNPGTQTFYLRSWNNGEDFLVPKFVHIYHYRAGKSPIAGLGGASPGTFRAFGENGETVDGTNTIRIPTGSRLILEWNSSNSTNLYAYSTVAHPQWGNGSYFDASNATAVRAQYGIQSIDNPGTQTFYLRSWNNGEDFLVPKSVNVIVFNPVCGNSVIEGSEVCDDGNTSSGDGCNAGCTATESGFTCTGSPKTTCVRICGNGTLDSGETCDDGNPANGDGCSASCAVESGYLCTGSPSTCVRKCGNGTIDSGETCDDGNPANGDGCSALCALEAGYTCTGSPSTCVRKCGNGTLDSGETCDDANPANGDGCSSLCALEAGYTCTGTPSVCTLPVATSSSSSSSPQPPSTSSPRPPSTSSSPPITTTSSSSARTSTPSSASVQATSSLLLKTSSSVKVVVKTSASLIKTSSKSSSKPAVAIVTSKAPAPPRSSERPLPPSSAAILAAAPSSLPPPVIISTSAASSIPVLQWTPPAIPVNVPVVAPRIEVFSSSSPRSIQAWKPECGNGRMEIGEECDDGAKNGTPVSLCTQTCLRLTQTFSSSTRTLAASIVQPPVALPPAEQVAMVQMNTYQSESKHPPVGATGPGSLALMAAGAAAGIGWVRRRR